MPELYSVTWVTKLQQMLKKRYLILGVLVLLYGLLSIMVILLHSYRNHSILLIVILFGSAMFSVLAVGWTALQILPLKSRLQLCRRLGEAQKTSHEGILSMVSDQPETIQGIPLYRVDVEIESKPKSFYLEPEWKSRFPKFHEAIRFSSALNIITQFEVAMGDEDYSAHSKPDRSDRSERKQRICTTYTYYGWVVIAFVLVLVGFWSITFSALNHVPSQEQIVLFVGAKAVSEDQVRSIMAESLTDENVRSYVIDVVDPEGAFYSYQFLIRGTQDADFFILPESKVTAEYCSGLFPEIPDSVLDNDFAEVTDFYRSGEKVYGIQVYDAKTQCGYMQQLIAYSEEDYFLFFNRKSLNIAVLLNPLTDSGNSEALIVVRALLENTEDESN